MRKRDLSDVSRTVRRYRNHVKSAAPRLLAEREDAHAIVRKLSHSDQQIILVHGAAGCGKSTIVSEVLDQWNAGGWRAAVARLDVPDDLRTSEMLGKSMGLDDSPVLVMKRVSGTDPALLIIDQMDAVSTFSGRTPDGFQGVDDILEELKEHPNIRVALIVRKADLDHDPRMSALLEDTDRVASYSIGDLEPDQVRQCLQANRARIPTSVEVLGLLRQPVNLSVFIKLSDSSQAQEYSTLKDLYDRYTRELRERLEDAKGREFDWHATIEPIVGHMSRSQTLAMSHSSAQVKSSRVKSLGRLVSEGVLVKADEHVRFFHESYFDYLFAAAFVAKGSHLCNFLLEEGQHLFRRAQVRQVLQYLQDENSAEYYKSVVDLLSHPDIRSHIKSLVISLLEDVPPDGAQWTCLQPLAWSGNWLSEDLLWILRLPHWFDSADEQGLWNQWLNDPQKVDPVLRPLFIAAEHRGPRVAELMDKYATTAADWQMRTAGLIRGSLNAQWSAGAIHLIQTGRADNLLNGNHLGMDIWWTLKSLAHEDGAKASEVLGALLDRSAVLAQQGDPFASEHLANESQLASYIPEIAQQDPAAFARHVLPFIVRIAPLGQQSHPGYLPQGQRWGCRWPDSAHGVDGYLFDAADEALRSIACHDYEACLELVAPLMTWDNAELRFLAARAVTAGDDADVAIAWLVSDPLNLDLGWTSGSNAASRQLIVRHSPHCSDKLFLALQETLMAYTPPHERQPNYRQWRGRAQYELLSALDENRLSRSASRRLEEWTRKFPSAPPEDPTPIESFTVGSPIADEAAEHMSDDHWLGALRKHRQPDSSAASHGDPSKGGARQLAGQLGEFAKDDPKRFANLALRFDVDIPAVHARAVLDSVAAALNASDLAEVCQSARQLYGQDVGQSIAIAVQQAQAVNDDIVGLLLEVAQDADPDEEAADNGSYMGDHLTAGLNCTRGQAALAIARVLSKHQYCSNDVRAAVAHLADDDFLSVRHHAAQAVLALATHDESLALDLAEHLIRKDIRVLSGRHGQHLLRWAIGKAPQRFAALLSNGLHADDAVAQETGKTWAILRYHDELPRGMPTNASDLDVAARLGAAKIYAESVAECLDDLFGLLDDEHEDIRHAVARSVWKIETLDTGEVGQLLQALLRSKSRTEAVNDLIHCLSEYKLLYPDNTFQAIELALETSGSDIGDIRTAASIIATDLWKLLLRIYKQGNSGDRERCLDLIDKLIELKIRGENGLDDGDRI